MAYEQLRKKLWLKASLKPIGRGITLLTQSDWCCDVSERGCHPGHVKGSQETIS